MKKRFFRSLQRRVRRTGTTQVSVQELLAAGGFDRFNAHSRNAIERALLAEGVRATPALTSAETRAHGIVTLYLAGADVPPPPIQPGRPVPLVTEDEGERVVRRRAGTGRSTAPTSDLAAADLRAEVAAGTTVQVTLRELLTRFSEQRSTTYVLRALRQTLEAAGVTTTPIPDAKGLTLDSSVRLTVISPRPRPPERTVRPRALRAPSGLVAGLGNLRVYGDRIVTPDGRTYRLSAETTASVDASGSVAATRGRDLAQKAVGGLLVPGGAFIFGNARERLHDFRELFLVVEDPEWQYTIQCHPEAGVEVRALAAGVRSAARALARYERALAALDDARAEPDAELPQSSASPEGRFGSGDLFENLRQLADLRDRGALTDDEFAAQKAKLLSDSQSD